LRWLVSAALAALLFALLPSRVSAQGLHGVVRDSATQQPVAGAVVMVLDASGVVLGRNITDEAGLYRVAAPAAATQARVVRIGFQPREVRLPPVADRTAAVDFALAQVRTMLSAVSVKEKSKCARRPDDDAALGLWGQARAGLLATIVAREANPASLVRLTFQRTYQGNTDHIARFTVDRDSADRVDNSFSAARSAHEFTSSGFATDSADSQILFGPDAEVLLDDAFASAYCFHLAGPSPARVNQVGLSFSAAQHPRDRIDIEGTLWVDTAARALTDIEFRYIGMAKNTIPFAPGGEVSFLQMANGIVLIDRWYLRGVTTQKIVSGLAGHPVIRYGITATEIGGELARAAWPGGTPWRSALGTLRLHAMTKSGDPAAAVTIVLADTHYRGKTDAKGDLTLDELLPGPYSVQIVDPRMSSLGLSMPTKVSFNAQRDSTFRAIVTVPTTEEYVRNRCVDANQWIPGDSAMIFGRIFDSAGNPESEADVSFSVQTKTGQWAELRNSWTTEADGLYQACLPGFDLGGTVRIRIRALNGNTLDSNAILKERLTLLPLVVPGAP
jgi:hypothetical protein